MASWCFSVSSENCDNSFLFPSLKASFSPFIHPLNALIHHPSQKSYHPTKNIVDLGFRPQTLPTCVPDHPFWNEKWKCCPKGYENAGGGLRVGISAAIFAGHH